MWQAVKNLILSYLSLCFHTFLKIFIEFALLTTFRVYGSIFWRNLNRRFLMKLSLTEKFVLLLLPWVEISFNLSLPSKFSQNDWIYIFFSNLSKKFLSSCNCCFVLMFLLVFFIVKTWEERNGIFILLFTGRLNSACLKTTF